MAAEDVEVDGFDYIGNHEWRKLYELNEGFLIG